MSFDASVTDEGCLTPVQQPDDVQTRNLDLGVYTHVLNVSPVRRAEEQRRRLVSSAAASSVLRYSTNPLHMVAQQQLMASLFPPVEAEEGDAVAQAADGMVTDESKKPLVPTRPTTAPNRKPILTLHSTSAAGPMVQTRDEACQTASATASLEGLTLGLPPFTSGHRTGTHRDSHSFTGRCTPPELGHTNVIGHHGGSTPPELGHTKVGEVLPVELMLRSGPTTKEYLERLLSRPSPFDDYSPAKLHVVSHRQHDDSYGSQGLEDEPVIVDVRRESTVCDESSDEEEDIMPNVIDSFTPTGNVSPSSVNNRQRATNFAVPRSPKVSSSQTQAYNDSGSLLEIVPTNPRPLSDVATSIARTLSVARGLKAIIFPLDVNGGVHFVDTENNSQQPDRSGSRSIGMGSRSAAISNTEGRMSFQLRVDHTVKHVALRNAATLSVVTLPESTNTTPESSFSSHGPFYATMITVNNMMWLPPVPPTSSNETSQREGTNSPPGFPNCILQMTSDCIFISGRNDRRKILSPKQLLRRRAAAAKGKAYGAVAVISMDGVEHIQLESVIRRDSPAVLITVVPSDGHSPHVRQWFAGGPTIASSRVSVVVSCKKAIDILSAFSSLSLQRIRELALPSRKKEFTIVHFNDVYNLIEREGPNAAVVGGAARFHTKLSELRERSHPLVLFSGDFMGPSLMSVEMKGKQMIDFFNQCGVHYGCFGNHEFDYGLKALQEAVQGFTYGAHVFTGSNTKWVMSNMFEGNGGPVAGASRRELFTWNGVRVGLIALCEDWIGGCSQLSPGEIVYADMFEVGESLALELRTEGAEVVIALSHCRLENDKQIMLRCPSIDLLLGGHDHFYKCVPGLNIIKSGEEFQFLSQITVTVEGTQSQRNQGYVSTPPITDMISVMSASTSSRRTTIGTDPVSETSGTGSQHQQLQEPSIVFNSFMAAAPTKVTFSVIAHPIHWNIAPSSQMLKLTARYQNKLDERMGGVVGRTAVPLDPRESTVRFKEGLLTGFVCDVIVQEMRTRLLPTADLAILGGAAFSGKTIIPAGVLTMGDIFDLFPNDTRVMALRMPGKTLRKMLTVMVRECPEEAPSFPHCSADLSFTINTIGNRPPRIEDAQVQGQPLDDERLYTVAVEDFAGKGSGKYKFLQTEAELLIEEENAVQIVFWLIDYFSHKKGQVRGTQNALDEEAIRADLEQQQKKNKKKQRAMRFGADSMMMSAVDNVPKFVLPIRQFKPVEFASTLESGALARLYAATTFLSEDVERSSNVALIEKVVVRLLKCTACRVYLLDKASNQLRPLVSPHGVSHAMQNQLPADNSSLAGYSVLFNCAVNTKNAPKDRSFNPAADGSPTLKVSTLLTFPIFYRKQCLGVVQAINKQSPQDLLDTPEWVVGSVRGDDAFDDLESTSSSSDSSDSEYSEVGRSAVRIVVDHRVPGVRVKKPKKPVMAAFTDEDRGLALLLSKQIGMQLHFSNMYQRILQSEAATKNLMEMARLLGRAQKDDSVQTMVLRITDIGQQLIGCDRCSLFLVEKGEMWTVVKTKDLTGNITIRLPIGAGVAGQAAQTGTRMNIHDAYKNPYFNPEADQRTGYLTKTILAVPMLSENGESILGVLQLINKNNGKVFTEADEELAQNFVNLAAIAVHNSFEIETLRLGRDESTLQVLPVHELNRITIKNGWSTIRRNLHKLFAMAALMQADGAGNRSDNDSTSQGDNSLARDLTPVSGSNTPMHLNNVSTTKRLSKLVQPKKEDEDAIVRAIMDFDDLRSEHGD